MMLSKRDENIIIINHFIYHRSVNTSITNLSVKKGSMLSDEWSPSRWTRKRSLPPKISLIGERPKSVVRVMVLLLRVPLITLKNSCSIISSCENIYQSFLYFTCHSSSSSFDGSTFPLTSSPFSSFLGGGLGFSTNFFSCNKKNLRNVGGYYVKKVKFAYLNHFIIHSIENEAQKFLGIFLTTFNWEHFSSQGLEHF